MSNTSEAISLDNPTREYLLGNFNKVQLQKHCRDIGITKVYVTKEKLVELILEKHRSTRPNTEERSIQESENNEIRTSEIMNIITELRERVNIRDTEIEELGELLKAANVTINKLNDRVSSLEDQVKLIRENSEDGATNAGETQGRAMLTQSTMSRGTLLLGDSNLAAVKISDIATGCSIRTIRGANTDLINCWVSEKLQWAPKTCILYCGLQDILENMTIVDIFDKLGSLITSLKQINESMQIYICELAPAVKAEKYDDLINNFNNQLTDWGASNGVSIIKSNLKFRLGTGEVDNLCFNNSIDEQEGNFLNRYGVIRLLDAISKQCTVFELNENWDQIIRQITSTQQSELNSWRGRVVPTKPTAGRTSHQTRIAARNSREYGNNESSNNRSYNVEYPIRYGSSNFNHQNYPYMSTFPTWRRNPQQQLSYQHRRQHRLPSPEMRTEVPRRIQPSTPSAGPSSETRRNYRPCYNCGEINHSYMECRFQQRLKCNNCGAYGHKTRLCNRNI